VNKSFTWRASFRSITKSGAAYLIAVSLMIGVLGNQLPFEPYDWIQQSISARFNSKPYNGNAVLIAVDESTLKQIDGGLWKPETLAKLITKISKTDTKQIIIEEQNFTSDTPEGREILQSAYSKLRKKPILYLHTLPDDLETITNNERTEVATNLTENQVNSNYIPASMIIRVTPVGAPANFLYDISTNQGNYPSIAKLMAEEKNVDSNILHIDLSYDPNSVPRISASKILNDNYDLKLLRNKQIVIGSTANILRDTVQTAQEEFVPRAVITILAAQTLRDGLPKMWGWLPAYFLALLASVAWLMCRAPIGRMIAITTFLIILASPLFFERFLIFQNTSNGIFLLLFVGIGRLWIKFRNALNAYQEIAEAKSWFLAQASHDLRQPIHAIGMLSARLKQTNLSQKQSELVTKISSSVDGASRMFQSLLDVATIESGTLSPESVPVTVNEILAEIDSQNALTAESAGVTLRFVPSDLVLNTDKVLAVTMLQNIVSNAIKYASGKKVLIGCRRSGGNASLCVYDRGTGISHDDLRQVSQEFFRASKDSKIGGSGTGLGLAIVHRLAVLLGLKFSIRSTPNKGTGAVISGFRLTKKPPKVYNVASQSSRKFLEGLNVCIMDDDIDTLKATEEILKQWGCIVTAYDSFQNIPSDCEIIVSDYDFGRNRTLANYADEIKKLAIQGIPTIIVTGHDPEKVRETMKANSMLILTKPARPAELRSALMSCKITISS